MKKLTLLSIGIISLLPACKKNDSDDNSSKIVGKWTMVQQRQIFTINGVETERDTIPYDPGCYSDYNANGSVYYCIVDTASRYTRRDTNQYQVKENRLLTRKNNSPWYPMDIITLTSNYLMLRQQDTIAHYGDTTGIRTLEVDLTK